MVRKLKLKRFLDNTIVNETEEGQLLAVPFLNDFYRCLSIVIVLKGKHKRQGSVNLSKHKKYKSKGCFTYNTQFIPIFIHMLDLL